MKAPSFMKVTETVLIGKHRVPANLIVSSEETNAYLETYWEDEHFGMRMIGDYVCDLFHVDVSCIQIKNDHRRMFDWAHNRQPSFRVLFLEEEYVEMSGKDVKHILSNVNAKELFCSNITLENFQFNKKFDMLQFDGCDWITMDNLMTMEANQIIVENEFTKKELNRFLKHWINGGSPSLKFFKIDVEVGGWLDFIDGLRDHFVQGAPGQRTFLAQSGFEYHCSAFGIQRNDGTIASLSCYKQTILLNVWPDEMGRTFDTVA